MSTANFGVALLMDGGLMKRRNRLCLLPLLHRLVEERVGERRP
jgi:hypothetical protein